MSTPKPKKTTVAKTKKTVPSHPPFSSMVSKAISNLKEKGGSSQIAILKYVMVNYKVGTDPRKINTRVRLAIRRGVKDGSLLQPKGPHGKVKLSDKKASAGPKKARKPAAKKAPKPKTASPKKTVKKSPAKKAAKKTKSHHVCFSAPKPKTASPQKTVKKSPAKKAAKKSPKKTKSPKKAKSPKPKKVAKKPAAKKSPKKSTKKAVKA